MDWAELNPDLLHHIAKNVRDISDFIRFRAVCRQWRSAVHPCDLPPQLPCLIGWKRKSKTSIDIQFCHLFSKKVYTVPINNVFLDTAETLYQFDSLNGLLLVHSLNPSKPWFLYNPLTGFQVQQPLTSRDVRTTLTGSKFAEDDKMCLWRYDDVKWTMISEVPCSNCEKVSYYHGRLYALSEKTGHIKVIDITTGNTVLVIRPPSLSVQLTYLVEAGGDLLGVCREIKLENLCYPKTDFRFEVYRLEEVDTNPYWKKVKCLGDRTLFCDDYGHWLCLKASDFEECQCNSIYLKSSVYKSNNLFSSIVRYDLEKDTTEVNVCSDNLWSNWLNHILDSPCGTSIQLLLPLTLPRLSHFSKHCSDYPCFSRRQLDQPQTIANTAVDSELESKSKHKPSKEISSKAKVVKVVAMTAQFFSDTQGRALNRLTAAADKATHLRWNPLVPEGSTHDQAWQVSSESGSAQS
ncbi:hypothetical protein LUZ61_020276 [Rhynchospora tenuis]|uniref:F-box domain-containing protein n=1 Tax=Rhynchospora tenuis TaxID=198213 RepID=A0AAD6ENP4_9POAL|nr:hypothetical protein LUZ61_020276 [Rhynchospora tenuis]